MDIEVLTRLPGAKRWSSETLETFFEESDHDGITYIVESHEEKDLVQGYALMFGKEIMVAVNNSRAISHMNMTSDAYIYLWVATYKHLP